MLSESLTNLRAEERQQLLFERTGAPALEAQVAIHFDNGDGRFPVSTCTDFTQIVLLIDFVKIDKDEIVLRRVIGRSKEGYYCINDKRVSKQEVINLLESAGFSRSNPYYIVQQGKVNDLTLMKDKERLNLLKEVAGTRVYEEKKQESLKFLREGDSKKEKASELLKYIEERLEELEVEKDELQKYDELDKQKRCIEYNLYQNQLYAAEANLEKLENLKNDGNKENAGVYDAVFSKQSEIKQKERDLKVIGSEIQILVKEKEILNSELQELITTKAKLELKTKEADQSLRGGKDDNETCSSELTKLEAEIAKVKENLEEATKEYQDAYQNENSTAAELGACESKLNALYSKMGRGAQYSSREERDSGIQAEISSINHTLKEKQKQISELDSSIKEIAQNIKQKSQLRIQKETEISKLKTSLDKIMKQNTTRLRQRDTYANERK